MKVERKFYCGAKDILVNNWAKKTEAEAVEHAKDILDSDELRDKVIIVKIIGVVKRESRPTKYEKVK